MKRETTYEFLGFKKKIWCVRNGRFVKKYTAWYFRDVRLWYRMSKWEEVFRLK